MTTAIERTAACSEQHPCDNPNHNHTGYRTPLPLLTDIRAVLESTLHTYVGNRAGRDELVRILRRMDDEALEQAEQRAHHRQYISAETKERLRLDSLSRVVIDGVPSEF